ncbi:MAG TPA: hypothetical protein PKC30_09920 [Saprospiraceae bacterium]|nr:hypothetical protein [Saprospiraceae bacterium]
MRHILMPVIFIFILLPFSHSQSGWSKPKGGFFGKLDYSYLVADRYYNISGHQSQTQKFRQSSLNWYGEYGIMERLTFITYIPVFRFHSFENTETVAGVGDLRLEIKYRIFPDGWLPLSISIAPEIPTGRSEAEASLLSNPQESINLPTGDGEFNVWSTLAISSSWGKMYGNAFGAYNYRTRYKDFELRDLYQVGIELGWNPLNDLWLNTKLRAQFSTGESLHPDLEFLRGDGTTYTLYSVEAYYKISKNIGFSATYLSGGDFIFPFRNIYIAPYFSIGIIYDKS